MAEAYIVAAARTPGGRRKGQLAGWHPADLGGEALNAVVDRSGIDPAAMQQAAGAAPKDLTEKLPTDVGQLLKSGSGGMPGLGGTSRFPGLPGLGGGFVPKKK